MKGVVHSVMTNGIAILVVLAFVNQLNKGTFGATGQKVGSYFS